MTFQTVPVDVVGQTYQHRSRSLSSQRTVNLIPEFVLSGRSQTALTCWPGSKSFSDGSGSDRGMHVFNGTLYKVSGETLESINQAGTRTTIGTIDGTNPCIFANDGNSMRIATGSKDYIYDGSTLAAITDLDLTPGNSVAYLNQQMINDSTGGSFQVSDVGDPDSINNLNVATAESAPDDTIRVFAFNERLYLFGEDSIETWYNSGTGNPPFDRIQGGVMNIGLASVYSVASTADATYFLASDRSVYRFTAYQADSVTSSAISSAFEGFSTVNDARSYIVNIEGQSFYVINFPTEGKTYAFNEDGNAWFELATGAEQDNYIGTSYAEVYGKRLIAKEGKILELDLNTFTDDSVTVIRERVSAPIADPSGRRIIMSKFQCVMEVGVGLITGQGVDPQMMFDMSLDGGESWTNEQWVDIGRMGEGRIKVEYYQTVSAYSIMVRMRVSDPVFISIHSASADIMPGGF